MLWTEEPGELLSMGSHRVGHNWSDLACMHALEKETATHSGILAWRFPGTEEPGGLLSMGSQRVGHDWSDLVGNQRYPPVLDPFAAFSWSVGPSILQMIKWRFSALLWLAQGHLHTMCWAGKTLISKCWWFKWEWKVTMRSRSLLNASWKYPCRVGGEGKELYRDACIVCTYLWWNKTQGQFYIFVLGQRLSLFICAHVVCFSVNSLLA